MAPQPPYPGHPHPYLHDDPFPHGAPLNHSDPYLHDDDIHMPWDVLDEHPWNDPVRTRWRRRQQGRILNAESPWSADAIKDRTQRDTSPGFCLNAGDGPETYTDNPGRFTHLEWDEHDPRYRAMGGVPW